MSSYTSHRTFQLWAYGVGHSSLILRSPNNEEDETGQKGFNIDIEFGGVGYLDLPDLLEGISIVEITEEIPKKFQKYSKHLGYKVFEIQSDGIYYIVASSYQVGKNKWLTENRILDPYLEYDELLATS